MSELNTEISSNKIEQSKVEVEQAKADSLAARDVTVTAKNESVAAKDQAVQAKDLSVQAKVDSEASAATAAGHESQALLSSNVSTSSKDAALAAQARAEQWANELEDVVVESGKHSALHWAMKAQQWAQATTNSLVFKGGYDASGNTAPATPADQSLAEFYRITNTGTIGGTIYNTGDSIIWDPTTLTWFKVDNTDAVLTVNGQKGDVVLDVYTKAEVATFVERSHISAELSVDLPAGKWYTIATNRGDRATARFAIWDTASGKHQAVIFYAGHMYGTDASNTITILDNNSFSGRIFGRIRIKESTTYDGAALQVYITNTPNTVRAAIVGDNVQSGGWELVNWLDDSVTPPLVSNYETFTPKSEVNLLTLEQGGMATTGEIWCGGDLVQHRVFHGGYMGPGTNLDADTVDGLEGQQLQRIDNGVIPVPEGTWLESTAPSITGAIEVTLPLTWSNTMMMFDVEIFNYEHHDEPSMVIRVAGYNYATNSEWVNYRAWLVSGDKAQKVRFGHNGTKCAIYIGEETSVWHYVNARVTNFQGNFQNNSYTHWNDGWVTSLVDTVPVTAKREYAMPVGTRRYVMDVAGSYLKVATIKPNDEQASSDTKFKIHAHESGRVVNATLTINTTYHNSSINNKITLDNRSLTIADFKIEREIDGGYDLYIKLNASVLTECFIDCVESNNCTIAFGSTKVATSGVELEALGERYVEKVVTDEQAILDVPVVRSGGHPVLTTNKTTVTLQDNAWLKVVTLIPRYGYRSGSADLFVSTHTNSTVTEAVAKILFSYKDGIRVELLNGSYVATLLDIKVVPDSDGSLDYVDVYVKVDGNAANIPAKVEVRPNNNTKVLLDDTVRYNGTPFIVDGVVNTNVVRGTSAQYLDYQHYRKSGVDIDSLYLSTAPLNGRSLNSAASAMNGEGINTHYLLTTASDKPTGHDHSLLTMSYSDLWSTQIAGDWRTNRFYTRVKTNGTVGTWSELLSTGVVQTITADKYFSDGTALRFGGGSNISLYSSGNDFFQDHKGGVLRLRDASSTPVDRMTFDVTTGVMQVSGDYGLISDRRVKDNFEPIVDAVAKVKTLNGLTYDRTDMECPRKTGLIAQEVQAVLPEAVNDDGDLLSVNYGSLTGLTVEAIKELADENQQLRTELDDLKLMVQQLIKE